MPSFNEVGFSKNELNDLKNALEFTVATDGSLNQATIDRMNQVGEIIKDMRQQIVDFDTAYTTETDPAAVMRVTLNAF